MKKFVVLFVIAAVAAVVAGRAVRMAYEAKSRAAMAHDRSNLKEIAVACRLYAVDQRGSFPPDFSRLGDYLHEPAVFVSPDDEERAGAMSKVMEWTSYVYLRGATTASPPDTVVAYLPPGHHKTAGGIVVFANGSAELLPLREFTATLNGVPTNAPRAQEAFHRSSYPQSRGADVRDISNLREIGMACRQYATDRDGRFPPDWSHLVGYIEEPTVFVSHNDFKTVGAMSNVMEWTSYVYVRGITTASSPDTVVAYLPPGHHKTSGGVVVLANGGAQRLPLREFTATLNRVPTNAPNASAAPR